MSIDSVMPSNHLILCRLLLLLPSIFPIIRVFSSELVLCIRWPKYWSFSFSIRPSNECSGLISFRIDCFDFFAVQGTLKSLLPISQFKSINFLALSFLYSPTLTSIGMSRYVTTKNKKNTPERLELKKYNPYLKKMTVHKEIK